MPTYLVLYSPVTLLPLGLVDSLTNAASNDMTTYRLNSEGGR